MAVPKKRTSHRRKGMRRSHDALKFNASVDICDNCGELKLRHHVCDHCGVTLRKPTKTTQSKVTLLRFVLLSIIETLNSIGGFLFFVYWSDILKSIGIEGIYSLMKEYNGNCWRNHDPY